MNSLVFVVSGTDLQCTYTADFGKDARVEWKFKNVKGSQTYVVFDGKPTREWTDVSFFLFMFVCHI